MEKHDYILMEIKAEYEKAAKKFKPFNSPHEGHSVILEEMDELWDEVKKQLPSNENMKKEAIQIAAMALRFVNDLLD